MPASLTRRILSPRLRRLDFLSTWQAWALGLGSGALAGTALAGFAPWLLGVLVFLGLLAAAAALAWSGEPVAVADEPSKPWPRTSGALVADSVPALVDLVSIPGGTFLMGSPKSEEARLANEGPVHEVRLSPFECMRLPVTRSLYHQITGTDPAWPRGDADDRPVNKVSWLDAVVFCNLLSQREGLTPCYQIAGRNVTWYRAANGYRLLTEAEWEYACRADSTTRWSFGDDEEVLGDHAWFEANSSSQPRPAGRKKPNTWGLYDMHGNVFEWCWDWFGSYSEEASTEPRGPQEGLWRVLRGGSFVFSPRYLRSAYRFRVKPGFRDRDVGFRCARDPRRQP